MTWYRYMDVCYFWIEVKVKLVVEGDMHNASIQIAVSM